MHSARIMLSLYILKSCCAFSVPPLRPLRTPFTMFFDEYSIVCDPAQQPTPESLAEVWSIRCGDEAYGDVCFQVSVDSSAGRVITFEMADDKAEGLSCFVMAALSFALSQSGARVVLPMEMTPMFEVATETLLCDKGEEAVLCCDTDGRALMPVPRKYAEEHGLLFVEREGAAVRRGSRA